MKFSHAPYFTKSNIVPSLGKYLFIFRILGYFKTENTIFSKIYF